MIAAGNLLLDGVKPEDLAEATNKVMDILWFPAIVEKKEPEHQE